MDRKSNVEKAKFGSIAILAASIAIMNNLLQVNFDECLDQVNFKIAVFIFAVVIPYLIFDVYFFILENSKDNPEQQWLSFLRVVIWILAGIGVACAYNILPNWSGIPTHLVFGIVLITSFLFRYIALASRIDVSDSEREKD